MGIVLAGVGMVAAPGIGIEPVRDLRPEGVAMNVLNKTKKIRLAVAQDGLVASLEKMADRAVSPVEVQGIGLIDALHDLGQGDIACLDQQVDVVAHENIRIDAAASAVLVHGEGEKVFLKIGSVLEDALGWYWGQT
jgi:hypothetical protein